MNKQHIIVTFLLLGILPITLANVGDHIELREYLSGSMESRGVVTVVGARAIYS
jgi:hypothetical protein